MAQFFRTLVVAFAAALVAAATAAPDGGEGLDAARALYTDGDFAAAGAAAEDLDTADGHALAARAYAAEAILADDSAARRRYADRTRAAGERAVALDPGHVEGRLYLAVGLWLEARTMQGWVAYVRGFPQRGRDLLRAAVADAPEDPWAHALYGAWNLEVARRGGRSGLEALGADVTAGAQELVVAMELAPDNAAIAVQYAVALLALDPVAYADHARTALDRAAAAGADDAFEAAMQARGAQVLAALEAGDSAALNGLIDRLVSG